MLNYIEYFKSAFDENPDAENWDTWFATHERELAGVLSPGVLWRLKKYPLMGVYHILKAHGFDYSVPDPLEHPKFHIPNPVLIAWLKSKVSESDVLKQLGSSHRQFQILKSRMQTGDEWWTFANSRREMASLAGRIGFAVVRNGRPVDSIVTVMS